MIKKPTFFVKLGALFFLTTGTSFAQHEFITTWKTDNPGLTNSTSIKIPTNGTGYNYDVDWENDGIYDNFGVTGSITHNYGVGNEGIYTVVIRGDFPRIDFYTNYGEVKDNEKLLSVEQWGTTVWTTMYRSFWRCYNLVINATDAPNLSLVTNFSGIFIYASSINQDISHWDVSNVTDMSHAFAHTTAFNKSLDNWDVSSVTNMTAMFYNAPAFNQDLNSWDVSQVTQMSEMFMQASSFNGEIGNWDVGNVQSMRNMFMAATAFNQYIGLWNLNSVNITINMFNSAVSFDQEISNWDVSNVTDIRGMFNTASSFNQDISGWDLSSIDWASRMFANATSFDQDLSNWDVSNIKDMWHMFNGIELSVTNYDNLLIGWGEQPVVYTVYFGGGNSKYCAGEEARNHLDLYHNWAITDGGLDCSTLNNESFHSDDIVLYPNPVASSFHIDGLHNANHDVQILDINGKVVKEIYYSGGNTINIEDLRSGIYFVNISSSNKIKTIKIIKD